MLDGIENGTIWDTLKKALAQHNRSGIRIADMHAVQEKLRQCGVSWDLEDDNLLAKNKVSEAISALGPDWRKTVEAPFLIKDKYFQP